MQATPRIDRLTVAGLALLLMPVLTMLHEIGGHAAMCLAVGSKVTGLGAFYVSCAAETGGDWARRAVAFAGPGIDVVAAMLGYLAWKRARSDLPRLVLWYVWLCCGFSAAGYLAYSGVTGIGDLGPGKGGGIGPLPMAGLWRAGLAVIGGFAYWQLIRAGKVSLDAMIGQGLPTKPARRAASHLFYIVLCAAAIGASLLNPVGLFITLASAAAASFGGKSGLISIGFATRPDGEPRPFAIGRSVPVLVVGAIASILFAVVLGPTITPG
ncbi:hypothetical protein [Novosphingobium sp.]|uniref:hypothetical protein n=1 Tax=Novosphingobium sp. TaxID=1874826 RepID=UPI0025F3AA50|nr:hypothetical protein [Novosphingobium sp.]